MDYIEAMTLIPVAALFDRLYLYCKQEPLHPNNTSVTRAEILGMVSAAKNLAGFQEKSSGFPSYDLFAFTLRNIHNKLLEGRGPCAFDPLLCVWMNNGTTILRSLYQAKGGR